jgi:hypothetical protein
MLVTDCQDHHAPADPCSPKSKTIHEKYLAAILLSFLLLLFPGIPFTPGLVLVCLSVGLATLRSPGTALVGISFMQCFSLVVRWKDKENILLAGFRVEIIMVFLFCLTLYMLMCRRTERQGRALDAFDITYGLFILWFFIRSIFYSMNIVEVSLIVRQYLLIPLLLPAAYFVLKRDKKLAQYILIASCLGAGLLALVNVAHYFCKLPLPWSRFWAPYNSVISRTFFGINLARMNPLLGGSGPGGAGVFYMALAATCLGFLFFIKPSNFLRPTLMAACAVLVTAAVLTMSYSVFVVILLGLFVCIQQLRWNRKKIVYLFAFFCLTVSIFFSNISDGSGGNYVKISSYISTVARHTFNRASSSLDTSEIIFGVGPAIKTGTLIGADRGNMDSRIQKLSLDQWWFVVFTQMGIIGLLLVFSFIYFAIKKYFTAMARKWSGSDSWLPCAGILFFCLCGYVHNFPLFAEPYDFVFMVSLVLLKLSSPEVQPKEYATKDVKSG